MGRLDDITLEDLQELREKTDGEIPRERVLAAIGRRQGDELATLAERHGVVEKTIRNWLDRFAREPIEQAPYNDSRPGRPSKLEEHQREQFFDHLQQPPTELGYEQQAWSPKLLLHYVKEEYGVEYSEGHARKLLGKAGLSCRTARPRNHEADPEQEAEFQETVEKNGRN
jgi:transposase